MNGWSRRHWLAAAGGASVGLFGSLPSVHAFGEEGAFHPRLLDLGDGVDEESRRAAGRWAWELMRRTSAPGRLSVAAVGPERLLEEPFLLWAGRRAAREFEPSTIRRMREYLRLGGTIVVDDQDPVAGVFYHSARKQLERVLPESRPVAIAPDHVLFKTFYLVGRPVGRIEGPPQLQGIVRGKNVQVVFCRHDLLGALARTVDGRTWAHPTEPGGSFQRERAIRLAVNLSMYVLCSDYKGDQVHAPFLMRRRSGKQ